MFNYQWCNLHPLTNYYQNVPICESQQKNATLFHFQENQRNFLLNKIRSLEENCKKIEKENQQLKDELLKSKTAIIPKQKRLKKRRTQNELVKNFKCPYQMCKKQYASTLALNLHVRVKHNGGTKKQRKNLLKKIISAQLNGTEIPTSVINLPPNYIEEKKQLIINCQKFEFCEEKRGSI